MYMNVCCMRGAKVLPHNKIHDIVPLFLIQIKIGSEEGYVHTHTHTHTHTHSMSQLMKWEAEIPLQALFCSDYTVTDRNKEK